MKQKILFAFFGTLMALSMGTAMADSDDDRRNHHNGRHHGHPPKPYVIKHRIADQERDIRAGYRSGALTRNEMHTLKHNLAKIKTEYQRAKNNDDRISMRERERLDHMLDRNHRMIRKLENNGIVRF